MNRYRLNENIGSHTIRRKRQTITTRPGEDLIAEEFELGSHVRKFKLIKRDVDLEDSKTSALMEKVAKVKQEETEKGKDISLIPRGKNKYDVSVDGAIVTEKPMFLSGALNVVRDLQGENDIQNDSASKKEIQENKIDKPLKNDLKIGSEELPKEIVAVPKGRGRFSISVDGKELPGPSMFLAVANKKIYDLKVKYGLAT